MQRKMGQKPSPTTPHHMTSPPPPLPALAFPSPTRPATTHTPRAWSEMSTMVLPWSLVLKKRPLSLSLPPHPLGKAKQRSSGEIADAVGQALSLPSPRRVKPNTPALRRAHFLTRPLCFACVHMVWVFLSWPTKPHQKHRGAHQKRTRIVQLGPWREAFVFRQILRLPARPNLPVRSHTRKA